MTEGKHTPGPMLPALKAHRNPLGYWSIGRADLHPSNPEFEIFRLEGDPDGEDEAMAHLIAAAPDLADAMEDMVTAWDEPTVASVAMRSDAIDKIRAALKKAKRLSPK